MSSLLEQLLPIVESETTTQAFKLSLSEIEGPIRYTIASDFKFITINADPKHLYPSNYITRNNRDDKEELYTKIAGYSMTAMFESPEYQAILSPVQCQPDDETSSSN
jgi:hypothetical protein